MVFIEANMSGREDRKARKDFEQVIDSVLKENAKIKTWWMG